jgi:hypothetical protein
MKILKLAVIPALALAAGLSLPACSTGAAVHAAKPSAPATAPVQAATAAPAPAAATTPAAAASPAGTWNVAYSSDPTSILGQYSIDEDGGSFDITTKTVLQIPDAHCALPAGTAIGSFTSAGSTGNYSGTENLWEPGTCANASTSAAFTLAISGSTMMLLVPGQQSVTLTSAGSSTPPSSTPTATPVATAPASSPADCTVPDFVGAGLDGHIAAATAVTEMANSCPPDGFHVVTVLTVSGPAGTPQGGLWRESPPAGSSAPPGSTVRLYFQP